MLHVSKEKVSAALARSHHVSKEKKSKRSATARLLIHFFGMALDVAGVIEYHDLDAPVES
jgi:hypothetical protein